MLDLGLLRRTASVLALLPCLVVCILDYTSPLTVDREVHRCPALVGLFALLFLSPPLGLQTDWNAWMPQASSHADTSLAILIGAEVRRPTGCCFNVARYLAIRWPLHCTPLLSIIPLSDTCHVFKYTPHKDGKQLVFVCLLLLSVSNGTPDHPRRYAVIPRGSTVFITHPSAEHDGRKSRIFA